MRWRVRDNREVALVFVLFIVTSCMPTAIIGSEKGTINQQSRGLRYRPDGDSFVITNGHRRFNRALYGRNSGFRVEAGDLPQFALYLPGMGGSLKFGLQNGVQEKWLINADSITARYRPGAMYYRIRDKILGRGIAYISVISAFQRDQMIVRARFENVPDAVNLMWAYGGATGRQFNRDGDIGADPESVFYLKPEYCSGNSYELKNKNTFHLSYGKDNEHLVGIFPKEASLTLADAGQQDHPSDLLNSATSDQPVIAGKTDHLNENRLYFSLIKPSSSQSPITNSQLDSLFQVAELERKKLAERIEVNTPDPYINTLGGALSIAAEGIWESPAYLHGAVAWRAHLQGWRGTYAGDRLGWHDRAHTHFSSYAESQYLSPHSGPPAPDPETNLARQKEEKGSSLFTRGYISRYPGEISPPHHYDMNQVWIKQLFGHFDWNGDRKFVDEMWPVISRHLDWETRCFDADGNGLYTAYASIWASDALYYSGGGTSYASAYNYNAYRRAANLAAMTGRNPRPYQRMADKIISALNDQLWLPAKGWYAEYQDLLGHQKLHKYPGLWSVYHVIDNNVPDNFQAYQMLRYVDTHIPHIPVEGPWPRGKYYTLSTTRWMPYTWSVNNVALAENLHTALAYWQGNRTAKAFRLWKSSFVESMYCGASPGNFQQLSHYDAMRGELYRDFADPIGMAARTLTGGLFGIRPHALEDTLTIAPGLPAEWDHAELNTPDIRYSYQRNGNTEIYTIKPQFKKSLHLKCLLPVKGPGVKALTINGKKVDWHQNNNQVNQPKIEVVFPEDEEYRILVEWDSPGIYHSDWDSILVRNEAITLSLNNIELLDIYDPQGVFNSRTIGKTRFVGHTDAALGHHTVFLQIKYGDFTWWEPWDFRVKPEVAIRAHEQQPAGSIAFTIVNHADSAVDATTHINPDRSDFPRDISLAPGMRKTITVSEEAKLFSGSNVIRIVSGTKQITEQTVINWDISRSGVEWTVVDLSGQFNDSVTQIFENRYLEPRAGQPTLQIPTQGLGDWASYDAYMQIDDRGLRKQSGENNRIAMPQGIPFRTPGNPDSGNIAFTSMWENYPEHITVPLTGRASHAYLLMAGSTTPMQSRFTNGLVTIRYEDGSADSLELINPDTWWPIEQDYYEDEYAFAIETPQPYRIHLKTGLITRAEDFDQYTSIDGFTEYAIDGGAATMLDLPLHPDKELQELQLETVANDVVIGLMGVTLAKP